MATRRFDHHRPVHTPKRPYGAAAMLLAALLLAPLGAAADAVAVVVLETSDGLILKYEVSDYALVYVDMYG